MVRFTANRGVERRTSKASGDSKPLDGSEIGKSREEGPGPVRRRKGGAGFLRARLRAPAGREADCRGDET